MAKQRLYLAGAMRGIPFLNFPAFDKAAADLREAGFEVFSPAEHDRGIYGDNFELQYPLGVAGPEFDLRAALAADTHYICTQADGIALLPGWEASSGAKAERALAYALGLPGDSVQNWKAAGADKVLPTWREITKPQSLPSLADMDELNEKGVNDAATLAAELSAELIGKQFVAATNGINSLFDKRPFEMPEGSEVRTVSATGGEKGKKLAALGAVDPISLMEVAEVAGFGATKYARYNYTKSYEWSLSYDALQRHLSAFWAGEDNDPESGLPHAAHAAWHCLALLTFLRHGVGTDDRFPLRKEA